MAVATGLLGNTTGGGIASAAKTATPSATITPKTTSVTISQVLESKPSPGSVAVGEVVQYTDAKGKTAYVVGKANGSLTKPVTTISAAQGKLSAVAKEVEKIQVAALTQSNKIELAEIKDTLKDAGLSTKEINAVIAQETASNKAEVKSLKGILSPAGIQYASRNADTGLLQLNTNTDGVSVKPTQSLTSLLAYDSPEYSQAINANVQKAADDIAKFKLTYGITQDAYSPGSDKFTGISNYDIYNSLDNGNYFSYDEATGTYNKVDNAIDWKQLGLSKSGARALNSITSRDTALGQQAYTVQDAKGNVYVTDSTGTKIKGGKALKDTGEVDANGDKIFAQTSNIDTKYNKVAVTSLYTQDKDGNFTYVGNSGVDYTHIDKQSGGFGGMIASIALSAAASYFGVPFLADEIIAPMLGLSKGSAIAAGVAGALVGGSVAGVTGQNVLTGAALGGLGSAVGKALANAASSAGGYSNLFDQIKSGDLSAIKSAVSATTGIADEAINSAGGVTQLVDDVATSVDDLAKSGIDASTVSGAQTAVDATTSSLDELAAGSGNVSPGVQLTTNAAGDIIDQATGLPYSGKGVDLTGTIPSGAGVNITTGVGETLATKALADKITDPILKDYLLNTPTTSAQTGMDVLNKAGWSNVGKVETPGLLDTIKEYASNPWIAGAAGLTAGLGAGAIGNLLNPQQPETPNYPAQPLPDGFDPNAINPATGLPYGSQDWQLSMNNLFKRQGVGAGNYLGYDLMNRLGDIPPELMSLLGTSAPTTGTTSGQSTGSTLTA